jgi:hypothetical protein
MIYTALIIASALTIAGFVYVSFRAYDRACNKRINDTIAKPNSIFAEISKERRREFVRFASHVSENSGGDQ